MKQIKLREAQKGFHKLLKAKEPFEVLNGQGVVVCWVVFNQDGTALISQKTTIPSILDQIEDGTASASQERVVCMKCKKDATYSGTVWEEGEKLKALVCSFHYQSMPSKKTFKKLQ